MKFKMNKKLFLIFSFVVFVLAFQFNAFNTVSDKWFANHQRDSEGLVLGRLIETSQNGFNSKGGFLLRQLENVKDVGYTSNYPYMINTEKSGGGYIQSFGFQGYFYGVIDKFLVSNEITSLSTRIFVLKFITSVLVASSLLILLNFFIAYYGYVAASAAVLLTLFSPWWIVFSNNLYWMLFLIVLPFLLNLYFLQKYESKQEKDKAYKYIYISSFITILLKSLAGYEYISTILISMVIPLVFFAIKNSWEYKLFFKRFIFTSVAGLLGFVSAIVIHLQQLKSFLGSYDKAVDLLLFTILKRTHGNPETMKDPLMIASLKANVFDVLAKYFNGDMFGGVKFWYVIVLLVLLSILVGTIIKKRQLIAYQSIHKAIQVSLWLSIFAPISWHILAKGHSYVHGHMNHLLWYVPFLLLGFGYIGFATRVIYENFGKLFKIVLLSIIILSAGIVSAVQYYNGSKIEKAPLIFSNDKFRLNVKGNYMYVTLLNCRDFNLDTRFFLHLYPVDNANLNAKTDFNNADFNWSDSKKYAIYNMLSSNCIRQIRLPNYAIKSLNMGQFNAKGRVWQQRVNMQNEKMVKEVVPFNLSDKNWTNGIRHSQAMFFIENTFENRQSIKVGDLLKFSHSGERTVSNITYSEKYINISLHGEKLSPELDGYPKPVLLENMEKNNE
ncbi:hypothetical protein A4G18_08860 [Pasteurellaceae bacterium Pebbles2]|nr:hypothetical protein [Pasteurellaceae bacterium Pebbles2]